MTEIERLKKEVAWFEDENSKLRELLYEARSAIWCWEPISETGKKHKQEISDAIDAALEEKE